VAENYYYKEKSMETTLERKKKELYKYLFKYHRGKENAVYCYQLASIFCIEKKDVCKLISKLRKVDGIPICSCCCGYYYPESYSDIVEVVSRFNKYLVTLSTTSAKLLNASVRT